MSNENPMNQLTELEELRREVAYLRHLSERSLGRILLVDTQSIAIRHELEQKRRGFALMADLAMALRPGSDYQSIFNSVSRRLNAALNMQRTAVLLRDPDGLYRVSILQGYTAEEEARIGARRLEIDPELLDPRQPVLITGADGEERLAGFRQALALPYLIASPVMLNDEAVAVLVTGRLIELPPFLPRLGNSDLETVQTVTVYLAAMLTGQRLEEEEARKQDLEEIMRTVFQASLDGYVVWDSGHMEDISPGALKLLELEDRAEFIREHDAFGLTNSHLQDVFKRVMAQGHVREELLLRTRSGALAPCEISHLPLKRRGSTCLLSYIRDLREQKKNEEALLAAKEQAEVAAKAKSAFLANMSHEIRTPMNAILGLSHLIHDQNLSEQQKEYLSRIEDSSDSLLRVINDVLDFSKIEAGKVEIEAREFHLPELLDSVVKANLDAAEKKGLSLTLSSFPPDALALVGDPVRLRQVLNNLIDNAIKFTENGAVIVSGGPAADQPGSGGGMLYEFSVADSGIGLDCADMEKLFTAFSQADNSNTRKYGGTGLGLAISQKIVELMGGRIWCESQPGEGSVFRFTVRFESPAETAAKAGKKESARNKAVELAAGLEGGRILLVEDNEVNQLVARKIMEKAGLKVSIAENGLRALNMLENESFDLVLMDIQMPEMDGLEATRQIRAQAKFAELPILAMTAHALRGDKELSLEAGMNGHITKPINLPELFGALSTWIPNKSRDTH